MFNTKYKKLIDSFLNDRSLKFEIVTSESNLRYHLVFHGFKGAFSSLRMLLVLDQEIIKVYVYIPVSGERDLKEMADYIARINYNLRYGKFEICHIDGSIRYQYGQDVNILSLSEVNLILEAMIYRSLLLVDQFSYGFDNVSKGTMTSEQAFAEQRAAKD